MYVTAYIQRLHVTFCIGLYQGDQKETELPWSFLLQALGAWLIIPVCSATVQLQVRVAVSSELSRLPHQKTVHVVHMQASPPCFSLPPSECELSRCLKTRHCGQSHRKPRRQRTSHPVCVLEEELPPQTQQEQLLNISHVKAVHKKHKRIEEIT